MMSDKLIDCSSIFNKPFFNLKTFIMILKLELCVSCFSPSLSVPSFHFTQLFGFSVLPPLWIHLVACWNDLSGICNGFISSLPCRTSCHLSVNSLKGTLAHLPACLCLHLGHGFGKVGAW